MNDVDESQVPQRGWLERLSFALTGEPQDQVCRAAPDALRPS